jgi:hypothetical protein
MRGSDLRTGELFSYVDLEQRVPVRAIRCGTRYAGAASMARPQEHPAHGQVHRCSSASAGAPVCVAMPDELAPDRFKNFWRG